MSAARSNFHLSVRPTSTDEDAGSLAPPGESATTTHYEKVTLFRAVRDAVGPDTTVIAGAGTYSTADSIDMAEEAQKAGCDGLLVVDALLQQAAAGRAARALQRRRRRHGSAGDGLQHPVADGAKIGIDTLLRAAEHDRIVALQESGYDLSEMSRVFAEKPDDFEVYSGNDDWTLAMLVLGAVGVVSVDAQVIGASPSKVPWPSRSTERAADPDSVPPAQASVAPCGGLPSPQAWLGRARNCARTPLGSGGTRRQARR